jgi:hypothetical protein
MPTAWMISPASVPSTWTPTTRSLARSTRTFMITRSSRFGNKPWCVDHRLIATAVFSTPEIGVIGHNEDVAPFTSPTA